MVHRRELAGEEILFGNQGDLFGNAMTWWDHGTGSIWSQPTGEAILGPLKGARLELISSSLTTWGAWSSEFPETAALDAQGDLTSFDLSQTVVVVDLGAETMTFTFVDLWDAGPANAVVAGVPIAVVTDPGDGDRWAVFDRRIGDEVLTLVVVGDRLVDAETGTIWDPVRGLGLEGRHAGESLAILPGFTSFPKDVPTFFPEAKVWSPG